MSEHRHKILWSRDGLRAEICSISTLHFIIVDKSDSPKARVAIVEGDLDAFIETQLEGFCEVSPEIEN
jgi:hypothetical protein